MQRTYFGRVADEAFEKGIEQGFERGIQKTQRELFFKQSLRKFPQLSPERLQETIDRLSSAELNELLMKILDANSPKDLGLEE